MSRRFVPSPPRSPMPNSRPRRRLLPSPQKPRRRRPRLHRKESNEHLSDPIFRRHRVRTGERHSFSRGTARLRTGAGFRHRGAAGAPASVVSAKPGEARALLPHAAGAHGGCGVSAAYASGGRGADRLPRPAPAAHWTRRFLWRVPHRHTRRDADRESAGAHRNQSANAHCGAGGASGTGLQPLSSAEHARDGDGMLIVRRREGESVVIGEGVEVLILECGAGKRVKLGIVGPREVNIYRKELALTREQNELAARAPADRLTAACKGLTTANEGAAGTASVQPAVAKKKVKFI